MHYLTELIEQEGAIPISKLQSLVPKERPIRPGEIREVAYLPKLPISRLRVDIGYLSDDPSQVTLEEIRYLVFEGRFYYKPGRTTWAWVLIKGPDICFSGDH